MNAALALTALSLSLSLVACSGNEKHYIVWSIQTSGQVMALNTHIDLETCKRSAAEQNVSATRHGEPYQFACLPEGTTPTTSKSALVPGKTYFIKPDGTPEEVKVIDFKDLRK